MPVFLKNKCCQTSFKLHKFLSAWKGLPRARKIWGFNVGSDVLEILGAFVNPFTFGNKNNFYQRYFSRMQHVFLGKIHKSQKKSHQQQKNHNPQKMWGWGKKTAYKRKNKGWISGWFSKNKFSRRTLSEGVQQHAPLGLRPHGGQAQLQRAGCHLVGVRGAASPTAHIAHNTGCAKRQRPTP